MKWYEGKRGLAAVLAFLALGALLLAGCALGKAPPSSLAKGAKLYDKWWPEVSGAVEPKDNQPLWALQTTNTRTGADTWRCKECHGWDYKGKDGAYGSGSHKTGFVGVYQAATTKSTKELADILKGAKDPKHNFASVLGEENVTNLANFLKAGVIDMSMYIDYSAKKPQGADAAKGKGRYDATCAPCHGSDGKKLNFGTEQAPEYIGTLAKDDPQEFLHKIRAGQPGTPMPSAIETGWSIQDVIDVLAYSQTLPEK